jgi:hypothetical protein
MSAAPHTIHFSELLPAIAGSPIAQEWEFFRRDVGRLIAEGHEGKWVLIKGEQIIGFFEAQREALDEGYKRFLRTGFVVNQIRTRYPVLRAPLRGWFRLASP